jgi:hypothetical protein
LQQVPGKEMFGDEEEGKDSILMCGVVEKLRTSVLHPRLDEFD